MHNELIMLSDENQGVLVPSAKEIEEIQLLDARWILVIEKEVYPDQWILSRTTTLTPTRQLSALSRRANTGKTQ